MLLLQDKGTDMAGIGWQTTYKIYNATAALPSDTACRILSDEMGLNLLSRNLGCLGYHCRGGEPTSAHAAKCHAAERHAALLGGGWLCRVLLPSGLMAVVVTTRRSDPALILAVCDDWPIEALTGGGPTATRSPRRSMIDVDPGVL